MENNEKNLVTVVTVVFGDRWHFLKKTLEALVSDSKVQTIVIVDNNSKNPEQMDVYARQYIHKIKILRQTENLGFAGAVSKGLLYARNTDAEYVLIMDDDCVLEDGGIDMFLDNYKYFPNNKVVLSANRVDVPGYARAFNRASPLSSQSRGTLFEVFSIKKIIHLFRLIFNIEKTYKHPMLPLLPIQGFVTGGSFIPMEIIRTVDVPDASLFIYGEDLDYSWRVNKAGYPSYLCARPIIHDIDMTFAKEGDHIWGLFRDTTPDYKVYYRMRNSVAISRKHTDQSKISLFINIFFWYVGLFILGLLRKSSWKIYFYRIKLIIRAVIDGYKYPNTNRPSYVKIPS